MEVLSLRKFYVAMLEKSHKHVTCEGCLSRHSSLFAHYNCDQVEDLNQQKSCSYYKRKQGLFLEGSIPRGVYCLNKGKVKIFVRGEEGKEQIIHVATDGEIIGFRSMFSGEPYRVSAETLEDSNICFIGKEDFLTMIDSNSVLRNGVMKELSKELGERARLIANMAQKTVRERLAFSLILLSDIYKNEPINLSREDMANLVGTATETLIRLIKEFKEEGLIDTATRKITILDKEGLARIAGK